MSFLCCSCWFGSLFELLTLKNKSVIRSAARCVLCVRCHVLLLRRPPSIFRSIFNARKIIRLDAQVWAIRKRHFLHWGIDFKSNWMAFAVRFCCDYIKSYCISDIRFRVGIDFPSSTLFLYFVCALFSVEYCRFILYRWPEFVSPILRRAPGANARKQSFIACHVTEWAKMAFRQWVH